MCLEKRENNQNKRGQIGSVSEYDYCHGEHMWQGNNGRMYIRPWERSQQSNAVTEGTVGG